MLALTVLNSTCVKSLGTGMQYMRGCSAELLAAEVVCDSNMGQQYVTAICANMVLLI